MPMEYMFLVLLPLKLQPYVDEQLPLELHVQMKKPMRLLGRRKHV